MTTLQDLAREALAVQDACNLSGVVHGFSRAITRLREALPSAGTDEINTHPVCVLWSDKIAHLTGTQTYGQDDVMRAYKWAHDTVEAANSLVDWARKPISRKIIEKLKTRGYAPRSYSGRGMYGANCVGVTVSQSDAKQVKRLFGGASTDSMGMDVIVYWRQFPWQHDHE